MKRIVAATSAGIVHLEGDQIAWVLDRPVTHLARGSDAWWAVTPTGELLSRADTDWVEVARAEETSRVNCVAASGSWVVVGTAEAHLLQLVDDRLLTDTSFEEAPTRSDWYTPWGGPPDVRSLAFGGDRLFVNVHVGGILASDEAGWSATIDHHADVHQVITWDGLILAASARGLGFSQDGGSEWEFTTRGLHATYERAVAVSDRTVLVSVSRGPRGGQAAIYRGTLDGEWEKCSSGLPEWFSDNIDTFRLAAAGNEAVFATAAGEIYYSADAGSTWEQIAAGLPPVKALEFEI